MEEAVSDLSFIPGEVYELVRPFSFDVRNFPVGSLFECLSWDCGEGESVLKIKSMENGLIGRYGKKENHLALRKFQNDDYSPSLWGSP